MITRPTLRFTPYAWAKLLFLRDHGPTEVGGFAITEPDDPTFVQDIRLVKQQCTGVTVAFDDDAVADFFDEQVDQGRHPANFGRIWLHTHPGHSAHPSGTDEETFARCFGRADWAVMFILASDGQTYAQLRFNVGPCCAVPVRVDVAFDSHFPAADCTAWEQEYDQNVQSADAYHDCDWMQRDEQLLGNPTEFAWLDAWDQYVTDDCHLEPTAGEP
jgi:proteasome lid subunit RPN8/RPN11